MEVGSMSKPRATSALAVRWMIKRDMAQVFAIERDAFALPMSDEQIQCLLRRSNCIGMVAVVGDEVVGYMVYEFRHDRIVLLRLAVAKAKARCGLGRLLILRLCGKLRNKRRYVVLKVRESNLAAQLFFRSLGFVAIRVVRGDYLDTGEDAFIFESTCDGFCHVGPGEE
jgi:[ribosomal protein S18]-alanine N-acetyltransferase